MAFTPITVTGSWRKPGPDGGELPSSGQVTFQLYEALSDDSETILPRSKVVVQLDDAGDISVILAATTDPSTTPQGVPYEVVELVDKQQRRYYVQIPHDAPGGTVDLATLQPMVPLPPAIAPARIPPDPTGATDGYVVTVEGGVYVLAPAAGGGGLTGPIVVDLTGETPAAQMTVDLSAIDADPTAVTVALPDYADPIVLTVTPPTSKARGPLVLATLRADNGLIQIYLDSASGPIPCTQLSMAPTCTIVPLELPAPFGEFWMVYPPPLIPTAPSLQASSTVELAIEAAAQLVLDQLGVTISPQTIAAITPLFTSQVQQDPYSWQGWALNSSNAATALLSTALAMAAFSVSGAHGVSAIAAATQAEYDALNPPDATTLYVITDTFRIYYASTLIADAGSGDTEVVASSARTLLDAGGASYAPVTVPYGSLVTKLFNGAADCTWTLAFANPGAGRYARYELLVNTTTPSTATFVLPGYADDGGDALTATSLFSVLVIGQGTPDVGDPASVLLGRLTP